MMPGMDGYDVCQELGKDAGLRVIPIVIVTAMEDPKLNQRAFAAGAKVCMTKPLRPDKFLHAVQMALLSAPRKAPPTEKKKA
jgi:CheY-like chemotaxis protein